MNSDIVLPLWVQILIATFLLTSGIFSLLSAMGLIRFNDFYMRMHPTAIVSTLGAWTACIATAIYLTYVENGIAWYIFLLIPIIVITTPITTALLARGVLFRWRNEAHSTPPTLSFTVVYSNIMPVKTKTEPIIETKADKTDSNSKEEPQSKKMNLENVTESSIERL